MSLHNLFGRERWGASQLGERPRGEPAWTPWPGTLSDWRCSLWSSSLPWFWGRWIEVMQAPLAGQFKHTHTNIYLIQTYKHKPPKKREKREMRFSNSQLFFGWQNSQGLQISSASLPIQPMPFQDVWFGWIWCHVYLKGRPLRVDSPWSKTAGSTWFNHVQSTMFNLVSVVFTMSWFNCVNTWFSLHPLAAFVRVTKWTRVCGWAEVQICSCSLE